MSNSKIGLALSGGAARGYAHIGVLRVLKENGIPIDFVAGTSAGSIAGLGYASGMSVDSIIEMGKDLSWFKMSKLSFNAKGLLSNKPLEDMIRKRVPFTRFEELMLPFAAVATNLETAEEKVFKGEGDVGFAIRASCAIPGVFAPVEDETGKKYVDGGVVAPIPAKAVRDLGAEKIIAVDVISPNSAFWGSPNTLLGVFFQSAMMLLRTASSHQHYQADVVIIPEVAHLRPDEIGKMDQFIELGEQAALKKLDEIKRLVDEKI
ncbi:MAG: patatin-like phospholipase family protein [Acidobacteria bacterium]|nr:MAG: patatin-like phospholipase family protein [Acidobacteriota bacterium]REK02776.1 MAG: patatin-like phospholipase family protein [Acidobacteriota bacterium]REK13419.1 MAG: patatin-like phospholipase family protein [Acidobacteriota bacterium]REK41413.1 MAG: patatin-like phospholipase family protein [Acidobacteriota bacterium]